jgi:hypothetical protein
VVFQAKAGLKQGFSLAKPRFLAEVVQKLKFLNNSIGLFRRHSVFARCRRRKIRVI